MSDIEISAFRHPDIRVCIDAQLVLKAIGIDSRVDRTEHGYAIFVRETDFAVAREQLTLYVAENDRPPPPPPVHYPALPWRLTVIVCLAVLWLVSVLAERAIGDVSWYRAGRIDGAAVLSGEAWRLLTALTLHADFGHLLVNLASAGVVVALTARQIGGGATALALLLAGALGNGVNVLVQGPEHLAVGASTAIFAGVGIAGAVETLRNGFGQRGWARQIGPLVLAVVVLTFFGTGGERTDVGAHWWGFVAGAVAGLVAGRVPPQQLAKPQVQRIAGAVAATLLIAAWWIALA